ncbi:DUF2161 domain-containing phosphodiesterase [Cognatishimia activa]|uniref:Uncharacterized protein n=1 Tax=Cognatishimia activa TaxID=1715691 RepID=A0A0P1ISJ2_9RHOB|nr:DUF2161 family putative PD-(D/E)XK-type phosphodiesterase [Cognatishimia activa]MEE2943653.1 DUF2161 family putative PD-(D/E)XK-type phosphodiesterase [Pseudomonadota bacterium]CUI66347.1 hypothetical protein TA5113_01082 [Cognatishimia activa]CUK26445.1 hypothetical protein TA5114_02255 [Cognatishimia activa]
MKETELYLPVKSWLEGQGFEVKAEVGAADVVACRPGEDPVIVELKTGFSLTLLQQAIARQRLSDWVYVAVPRWKGKSAWRSFKANVGLCKRLGIGVMSVNLVDQSVHVHADPAEFRPRKSKPRKGALLKEFERRVGDPNLGGTNGKIVTGYLQEAERCLAYVVAHGPSRGAVVAKEAVAPAATAIMRDNHYGWFQKVDRGVYEASPEGLASLKS